MRNTRFFMLFFICTVVLLFVAPYYSPASSPPGNGTGGIIGALPGGVDISSGGGASGAPVRWNEILNPNDGPHKIGKGIGILKANINKIANKYNKKSNTRNNIIKLNREVTKEVVEQLCKKGVAKVCPAWVTKTKYSPENQASTWYKIHPLKRTLWSSGQRPSPNIPVAFNIRIWRQDRNGSDSGNFKLIFRRSLAAPNGEQAKKLKGNATDLDTTAPVWKKPIWPWDNGGELANSSWWNGFSWPYDKRTTEAKPPKPINLAGAISYPNPSKGSCQDNLLERNDINGTRKSGGFLVRPSIVKTPAIKKTVKYGNSWCYWEGEDFGDGAWRNGNEFGSGLDINGKGLKEALFVKWDFNNYRTDSGRASFRYKFEGAPGQLYIIHAAIVDSRQNIMGDGRSNFQEQQIKAFFAKGAGPEKDCTTNPQIINPDLCPPPCENDPSLCAIDVSWPSLATEVWSESPVLTKQKTTQTAAVVTKEELLNEQSVLPYSISMSHYTPQLNHSLVKNTSDGIARNTYTSDYIDYEDDFDQMKMGSDFSFSDPDFDNFLIRGWENGYIPSGTVLNKIGLEPGEFQAEKSVSKTPAYLNPIPVEAIDSTSQTDEGEIVAQKEYRMTWNTPTLQNPCLFEGSYSANRYLFNFFQLSGVRKSLRWPEDIKKCSFEEATPGEYSGYEGVPIVNAWDDAISAGSASEVIRVNKTKNNTELAETKGDVLWHSLRCAENIYSMSGISSNPKFLNNNTDNCQNKRVPALGGYDGPQRAQSTVLLAETSPGSGRAYLNIKTEVFGGSGSGLKIYPRGEDSSDLNNLVSINPGVGLDQEINLCRKWGFPTNTRYMTNNNEIKTAPSSMIGDPGCRGFALKWEWITNRGCQAQKPSDLTIRAANTNPGENRLSLAAFSYSEKYPSTSNPNDRKNNTAPFRGPYPTSNSAINSAPKCPGNKFPTEGSWKIAVEKQDGWGSGNDGGRINLEQYFGPGASEGVFVIEFDLPPVAPTSPVNPSCTYPVSPGVNPVITQSCWSVSARYSGFKNYVWESKWIRNYEWVPNFNNTDPNNQNCPVFDNINPDFKEEIQEQSGINLVCNQEFSPPPNIAYIKVFGSENSR